MTTMDLFGEKPRRPRRVLMHVLDAGDSGCGGMDESSMIVRYWCKRCGTETDWMTVETVTEAKRGIPCETCNKDKND